MNWIWSGGVVPYKVLIVSDEFQMRILYRSRYCTDLQIIKATWRDNRTHSPKPIPPQNISIQLQQHNLLQDYRNQNKKHRRISMPTTIEQRFNKQYTVLLHQYKIFQNLQKQQHFDICSNAHNYLNTIDQLTKICDSLSQNYSQLITDTHTACIYKIQHEVIGELMLSVNELHKKMKSERNNTGVVGPGVGYCEFCGENMQENKIKRIKMALQEDYKQQFYLVLEQLKRLSEEKIFSEQQNKQFEQVLVAQLSQRQKVLKLNDKRMEQFIDILNSSLVQLKKMKESIFPDEEEISQAKEAEFKKMNHLNEHISTFLQTSFEKKIPPWIHKMFQKLMQMYLESVNAKKRENGVQAYLDDPELRMARAQNRELHRNNKELNKQIAQLKEDYKNLQSYRTKQAGSYTGISREHIEIILSNLNSNPKISQKNSSRRSTVKKTNRSHSKNSNRRNSSHISNSPKHSKQLKDEELANLVLGDVLGNKKAKQSKNIKPIQKRNFESIISSQGSNSNSNKNISGFFFPDIKKKRESNNPHNDDSIADYVNNIERKTERKSSRKMNDGKQIDHINQFQNRTINQKQLSNRSASKQNNNKMTQKSRNSQQKKNSIISKSKKNVMHKKSDSKGQQAIIGLSKAADPYSDTSGQYSIKTNPNTLIKMKNHKQIKNSTNNYSILHNTINKNEYGDASIMKIRSSQHYEQEDYSVYAKENRDADTEKMRKVSEDLAENAKKKLENLYFNYEVGNIRKSNESGHSSQSNNLEGSIRRYQNSCFDSDDGLMRGPQQIPEELPEQNSKSQYSTPLKIKKHQNSINSLHSRQHADSNFSNGNSSILRNSSIGSISPQKQQKFEEQRQTLQDFSQKIFRTMKKHNLLPEILNIQQFQAILREQDTFTQEQKHSPISFQKKQYFNKKMGTIKENINPIEQDSLYPKNSQQSPFKINTIGNEYYSRMLPSINAPKKNRYGQHFYILFYNKKQAFKYEQNLSKNYHKRRNHHLTAQQKVLSLQIYDRLSKKRCSEREQYNKICSVIRYPFDCLYNDFQTINFLTQMTYETFQYYFQKIAMIHKKCERNSKESVCEHIEDFFRKI